MEVWEIQAYINGNHTGGLPPKAPEFDTDASGNVVIPLKEVYCRFNSPYGRCFYSADTRGAIVRHVEGRHKANVVGSGFGKVGGPSQDDQAGHIEYYDNIMKEMKEKNPLLDELFTASSARVGEIKSIWEKQDWGFYHSDHAAPEKTLSEKASKAAKGIESP